MLWSARVVGILLLSRVSVTSSLVLTRRHTRHTFSDSEMQRFSVQSVIFAMLSARRKRISARNPTSILARHMVSTLFQLSVTLRLPLAMAMKGKTTMIARTRAWNLPSKEEIDLLAFSGFVIGWFGFVCVSGDDTFSRGGLMW